MEYKLLIINPQDKQEIVKVEKSGSYFDKSKVIWDERKDGQIPNDLLQHIGYLDIDIEGNLMIDFSKQTEFLVNKVIEDKAIILKECIDNRKKEYPNIEECVHAILDNTLDALQAKRFAVKAKYPLPKDS